MNPVLLKPQSEMGSQVVVQGRVVGNARARDYQAMKPGLMPHVLDSFARMRAEADIVLVEGAGSASEINLRAGDIANMGFARAADVPVVVVGDIDRGGVIASLVGTHTRAGRGGPRHGRRLHRQPDARRPVAVRTRHGRDRRAYGLGRAGPGAVLPRRPPPAGRGCGRPGARPPARRRGADRGAGAAMDQQFRRSRPAGGRTRRGPACWCRGASRCRCATW